MMYPMGYYMDWTYIFVLIGAVISLIASANVKSTYQKYSHVRSMTNMTGVQAALKKFYLSGLVDASGEWGAAVGGLGAYLIVWGFLLWLRNNNVFLKV